MLTIVHLFAGALALLLSAVPAWQGNTPFSLHADAVCLALIGLLNLQLIPTLRASDASRGPVVGASALLLAAATVQALVILMPLSPIAGQPVILASLLLATAGVALNLAGSRRPQPFEVQRPPARAARQQQPRPATPAPTTPSAVAAQARQMGTVKWFNTTKGFGFICPDEGEDVFVHFRAIRGEGHRFLMEGQRVEFSVQTKERGPQAEDVVALA